MSTGSGGLRVSTSNRRCGIARCSCAIPTGRQVGQQDQHQGTHHREGDPSDGGPSHLLTDQDQLFLRVRFVRGLLGALSVIWHRVLPGCRLVSSGRPTSSGAPPERRCQAHRASISRARPGPAEPRPLVGHEPAILASLAGNLRWRARAAPSGLSRARPSRSTARSRPLTDEDWQMIQFLGSWPSSIVQSHL